MYLDKLSFAHFAEGGTLGKLCIFFLGQACFDNPEGWGVLNLFMAVNLSFHGWIFQAAQAAKRRAWGSNPNKIPAGQNERLAKFGTVVEFCFFIPNSG
ncbi:MAG: hypothetical protein K1W34_18950 [Lachnospiraceae bacterium]